MNVVESLKSYKPSLLWFFCNSVVSHLPSIHIRHTLLRLMGMQMSENVRIYKGFHIREPRKIIVKDGASIGPKVLLDGREGLTIGKSAVIAYEAIIWTMNHDYNNIYFAPKGGGVSIGDYSWICSRSIILPGISIGEGAVVASGAVVTKNVEPYTIVGGIPAKKIGVREKKNWVYGYNRAISNEHFI